jgi:predicted permease
VPDDRERGEIRPGVARIHRLPVRGADRARSEADEEIRLHLALRTDQLVRGGLSPEAARAEAERRFGPLDEARARLHTSAERREERMRMREMFEGAWQDVRIALRGMRRSPAFVVTAVLCLALGIGANAATFSLFEQVILRQLPVKDPDRLVNLGAPGPKPGSDSENGAGDIDQVFSYPMFRDLERAQTPFVGIAAHRQFFGNFAYGDQARFGQAMFVSGSYFPVLGLRPALGRLLGPADDESIGGHPVVVLGHGYWVSALGADSSVIGKPFLVNGHSLTIVGVAPPGFDGTTLGMRPQVFVPMTMTATIDPFEEPGGMKNRRRYSLYLFARLRPGVSIDEARRAINATYRPIVNEVEAPLQVGMSAATLARFRDRQVTLEPGARGQSELIGQTRTPLLLLFGITGLVVLIACANVANLLLARGAARAAEISVRVSLGAGRRRLLAQLLTESLLLAALGGAASLLVARATISFIASLIPGGDLGPAAGLSLGLHAPAVVFALVLALGTGLLFGLFPALHATRPDLITAIRASSGQPSGARAAARFRSALVVAQIALSMALLGAAGLFIESLRNVSRVDLGLETEHVLGFALAPALNGYPILRSVALFDRVEEDLARIPGVTAAVGSGMPILANSSNGGNVHVEGFDADPDTDVNTRQNRVGAGFFHALGIPLLAGREFTAADRLGAPKVAIVNEAFTRKFKLGRDPVGKRIGDGRDAPLDYEIVGLVKDAAYSDVKQKAPPVLYYAIRQDTSFGARFFYLRTALPPERMTSAIRDVVKRLDPALPIVDLKTLPQQVRESTYLDRMISLLSAAFAALATLLAAVGLYGVLAYTVAQRTREIGVRMALGASGGRVRAMVLAQVGRMTLVGAVIGVAGALALGKAAESLLFGLDGHDPMVIASSVAVLSLVALAAGYLPAWRASRVEPMRALRSE